MNVEIRPVQLKDAPAIHRIALQENVLPNMVFLPSMRLDAMEKRIQNLGPNQYEFVAETDENIVGFIGMTQGSGRRSHVGEIFIGVDQDYHGKGIGTSLLIKMITLSDEWLMLERLELDVLVKNEPAKKLYEKHGFVTEGLKKGFLKTNGKLEDAYFMARYNKKDS